MCSFFYRVILRAAINIVPRDARVDAALRRQRAEEVRVLESRKGRGILLHLRVLDVHADIDGEVGSLRVAVKTWVGLVRDQVAADVDAVAVADAITQRAEVIRVLAKRRCLVCGVHIERIRDLVNLHTVDNERLVLRHFTLVWVPSNRGNFWFNFFQRIYLREERVLLRRLRLRRVAPPRPAPQPFALRMFTRRAALFALIDAFNAGFSFSIWASAAAPRSS